MNSCFPVTRSTLSAKALFEEVLPDYDIGIPTECKFLNLGLNDTYIIKTTTDRNYIFRIYRLGWRTLSEILYELDVLAHLSRKHVPVSTPLPDKNGRFTRTLPAPEGTRHAVLFTYAPGKEPSFEEAHAIHYGKAVANIHSAMHGFMSDHARFSLDLDYLIETPLKAIAPFLAHRTEDLDYLKKLGDTVHQQLALLPIEALDKGFCHGDIHSWNANMTNDGVVTFFDFDCCGPGWRAYDLAVFRWSARHYGREHERWEPFLKGYQAERNLKDLDVNAVPLFIGIRHLWLMGVHAANADDLGFGWVKDSYFERGFKFLRDWEGDYLTGRSLFLSFRLLCLHASPSRLSSS